MKEFKSFFKTVGGNEGSKCKYPTRLDMYGCGCQHDCKYCYAKSLLEFRGLWNPYEPSVADIVKISKKLEKWPDGHIIRLGGMTDCFQPIEKEHKVTYQTLQKCKERRIPYLIVTKSDLVATDEYIDVLDKELAHIQISVTTTDDAIAIGYEQAVTPSKRIRAIEKLQRLDFDVQLRLSPFIPQYIDFDILNNVRCNKILVEFLRVNHWIKQWFDIDFAEYSFKSGGYYHLPLDKKLEYISKVTGFDELTVCEDVTSHYEYWKENVNPNKDDCCNLRK